MRVAGKDPYASGRISAVLFIVLMIVGVLCLFYVQVWSNRPMWVDEKEMIVEWHSVADTDRQLYKLVPVERKFHREDEKGQ